jgi:hypothetical protein
VLPVAPCSRNAFIRRRIQRTGQQSGLPLRPRRMTSLRTTFFWLVKVRLTKVVVSIGVGAGEHIKAVATHKELDILKKERARFWFWADGLLAWTAQENEGKADRVSNSAVEYSGCGTSDTKAAHYN